MRTDRLDPPDPRIGYRQELYNLDAVPYESILLGCFEIFHGPANDVNAAKGLPKNTGLNFAYSRDGVTDWLTNGRPDYNPVTQVTTVNGVPQVLQNAILRGAQGNILFFVDRGRMEYLVRGRGVDRLNPNTDVGSVVLRESNYRVLYLGIAAHCRRIRGQERN